MSNVTVRGPNLLKPPLFASDDASLIEFRDSFGDLMALMIRVFDEVDGWGLITKGDEDWESALIRYGYKTSDKSIMDILGPK